MGSGWIHCCTPTASFLKVLFSQGRALRFGICGGKGPLDINEATSPCSQWLSPLVFCNMLRIPFPGEREVQIYEGFSSSKAYISIISGFLKETGTDANCKTKNRADANEASARLPLPRTHLGPPVSGHVRDAPSYGSCYGSEDEKME